MGAVKQRYNRERRLAAEMVELWRVFCAEMAEKTRGNVAERK